MMEDIKYTSDDTENETEINRQGITVFCMSDVYCIKNGEPYLACCMVCDEYERCIKDVKCVSCIPATCGEAKLTKIKNEGEQK